MTDKTELRVARFSIGAICMAGLLGIYATQLGFVAQVVALLWVSAFFISSNIFRYFLEKDES